MSKARLDLGGPEGEVEGFANDRRGIAALVRRLGGASFVVLEATGRLQHALWRALDAAGVAVVEANPARVRGGACPRAGRRPDPGARADGQLAKTDALDLRALARYGAATTPAPTPWPGEDLMQIRELESAHRTLVADRARLKTQL